MLPQCDKPLHPPKQRVRVVLLRLDVDRLVVIFGVDDDGKIEPLRIRPGETRVAVGAPLHRRADAVAIAEIDVVAHADLVAVIDHRRAGQREQQAVQQFDAAAIVAQQRCQAAADAQIDPRLRIVGVDAVHVVPLFVGDHFQRQLVVVPQEERPLARFSGIAGVWSRMSMIGNRSSMSHRHEHPRHQREMKRHVALVAVAEIGHGIFRPLVGFRQ